MYAVLNVWNKWVLLVFHLFHTESENTLFFAINICNSTILKMKRKFCKQTYDEIDKPLHQKMCSVYR